MWWFSQRRGVIVLAWLALCGVLAACGFRPLYAPVGEREIAANDDMSLIYVRPLPDRTGQQLHNLLLNRLNPRGQPRNPGYVLNVRLSESIRELGIRKDETATRANLRLEASFTLRRADTRQVLIKGRGLSVNSYNILQSQYATLTSENDARARGLRELSDFIQARLAAFFVQAREAEST